MPSLPAPAPSTLSAHDAVVSPLIAICPNDETPCRLAYTTPASPPPEPRIQSPQSKPSLHIGHARTRHHQRPHTPTRCALTPTLDHPRSTIDHRPPTSIHLSHAPIHPCTNRPVITGRHNPQERFIEWVNTHADVQWVRMIDMANDFRARVAPPAGARMPRGVTAPGATGSEQ